MDFSNTSGFLILILTVVIADEHASQFNGDALLKDLKYLARDLLGVEKFQKYVDQQEYKVSDIDGHSLITSLSNELHQKFRRRISAVTDLRDAIEDAYQNYVPSHNHRFPSCCEKVKDEKIDKRLNVNVDLKTPCVIRNADQDQTEVLTEDVVEVMKKNMREIIGMKWQYFGDHEGRHTSYPHKYKCDQKYDPRYRPWYVAAATPDPKDVVIVIDTSGSMRLFDNIRLLDIASKAADTIISFLNPNDRVAVVSFSSEARTYSDESSTKTCYNDELAVATHTNKETLKKYLDSLKAHGETEYGLALKKAFAFFKNSNNLTDDNIRRDKVILFLTDGAPSDDGQPDSILQIIQEENAKLNNTVVILTYGFGNGVSPDTADLLKKMANQVTHDETHGEVTAGVFRLVKEPTELIRVMGSFYTFFSRPSKQTSVVFTVPYNDAFGIGLVMSACLPVHHERVLKGVTCVDISVSELLSDVTYFRHGQLSYAFMTDDQGRVMMHPLMPNPYYVSNDPVYLKATTLETAFGFNEIMKSMMRHVFEKSLPIHFYIIKLLLGHKQKLLFLFY